MTIEAKQTQVNDEYMTESDFNDVMKRIRRECSFPYPSVDLLRREFDRLRQILKSNQSLAFYILADKKRWVDLKKLLDNYDHAKMNDSISLGYSGGGRRNGFSDFVRDVLSTHQDLLPEILTPEVVKRNLCRELSLSRLRNVFESSICYSLDEADVRALIEENPKVFSYMFSDKSVVDALDYDILLLNLAFGMWRANPEEFAKILQQSPYFGKKLQRDLTRTNMRAMEVFPAEFRSLIKESDAARPASLPIATAQDFSPSFPLASPVLDQGVEKVVPLKSYAIVESRLSETERLAQNIQKIFQCSDLGSILHQIASGLLSDDSNKRILQKFIKNIGLYIVLENMQAQDALNFNPQFLLLLKEHRGVSLGRETTSEKIADLMTRGKESAAKQWLQREINKNKKEFQKRGVNCDDWHRYFTFGANASPVVTGEPGQTFRFGLFHKQVQDGMSTSRMSCSRP